MSFAQEIPALDSVGNQKAEDFLRSEKVQSQAIHAGDAIDPAQIASAENEERARKVRRFPILSAEEVRKASLRTFAVRSAHTAHVYSAAADTPQWAREMIQGLQAVRTEIGTLKADVGTLKADVGTLKADVGTLKADVGTLKTDVGTLKADVGTLKIDFGTLKAGQTALNARMVNSRVTRPTEHLAKVPTTGSPGAPLETPVPVSFPPTWQAFITISQTACAELETYYCLVVGANGDANAGIHRRNALAPLLGLPPG